MNISGGSFAVGLSGCEENKNSGRYIRLNHYHLILDYVITGLSLADNVGAQNRHILKESGERDGSAQCPVSGVGVGIAENGGGKGDRGNYRGRGNRK